VTAVIEFHPIAKLFQLRVGGGSIEVERGTRGREAPFGAPRFSTSAPAFASQLANMHLGWLAMQLWSWNAKDRMKPVRPSIAPQPEPGLALLRRLVVVIEINSSGFAL